MKINFKDILYRHRHILATRIRENTADEEDYTHIKEVCYLIDCLREYKTQDAQLATITKKLDRKL